MTLNQNTITSRFPTAAVKAIILNLLVIFILAVQPTPVDAQSGPGDMRFILQTQGGLTAYTELLSPVSLLHARQLLAAITVENGEFVYGDYFLAGQTYSVKLAIGAAGWIIAFHPPDYASQYLRLSDVWCGDVGAGLVPAPEGDHKGTPLPH